jgi:hypothetical protein
MSSSTFSFSHPTSVVIAGPSSSGKTCFVVSCLKYSLIQPFPSRVIWFYKEWQPAYDELKGFLPTLEFVRGIDSQVLESIQASERNLVVIDDLMSSAGESKSISKLFTQESHHKNLTVFFLVQNLFYQGKEMRTISLNAHYLVLYKNPRDKAQIRYLAQQIYPQNSKFLSNVYEHATAEPHTYLVIDLHPETPEQFRILTNIFPDKQLRFYLPLSL